MIAPPRRPFLNARAVIPLLLATATLAATSDLSPTPPGRPASPPGLTSRPLRPPGPSEARTLFTVQPATVTGLQTENRYDDPKMRGELYREFETSSVGTGVAIGDYDGDGRPDLFVVSKTESCRLFRNLGDYKFEDVTDRAGVGDHGVDAAIWKQGATFVDVNNDGQLDLYVCRFDAPNLLYINQGDGTFKEGAAASGLAIKDSSVMAAFCDYDRDGWLDLYLVTNLLSATHHPHGQRGYLLHNNGDGTFRDVTTRLEPSDETQSHSATWWDYDNDGWPDLYVANDYGYDHPDKLYRNNRDGSFTDIIDQAVAHTSFSSMGADLGDVNNDGLIDFLVADMAGTTHAVDQHSMADARGQSTDPESPVVTRKYHRNALLLSTGTDRVQEAAFLAGVAATDWTWSVRFEDFDNDGHLDLHVTNGLPRDPGVDVQRRLMNADSTAERIRIMLETPPLREANLAFRNHGDLTFENVSSAWGLDEKGISFGAACGDFNGTGHLDLVYSNYQRELTFLRNEGQAGHRIVVHLRGTVSNRYGVGATVRIESALGAQVRQLVLARGYLSSSEPLLHFGLGEDTLIQQMTVTWPSGHVQQFGPLPADQAFTITEPAGPVAVPAPEPRSPPLFTDVSEAMGLNVRSSEVAFDETTQQPLLPFSLDRRGPSLAVGQLGQPGTETLVIGGTAGSPAHLLGLASGASAALLTTSSPSSPESASDGPSVIFDADGDGTNDLLISKAGSKVLPEGERRVWLYPGKADGSLAATPAALSGFTGSVGAMAAADFERSGRLGVFIGGRVRPGRYPEIPESALFAVRNGRLENVTDDFAPGLRSVGLVTSALWSDVDGDGWVDLLVALEWGHVKYFHNDQGRRLTDRTVEAGFASAGTGWWTALAAADFNGDGQPDYVAGNQGLNTQYHATDAQPALLFAGDFKGDGSHQLIEAYYEGEALYPWRSRRTLGAVFPAILKKYPKADLFGRATLAQIFGEEGLRQAGRRAATQLQSGVFLSQPDGTYRFTPLPRIAQISPLQGVVAGDFDGDGFADLYAVQNSYAPIPAVGRHDAGLSQLLRGDGRGNFLPVPPRVSGLVVPGDAKALVTLDLNADGWPDFVLSRNNSTMIAYRNTPQAGRHSLSVRLAGKPGNSTAVGARATLELADGSTQTSEVYAGGGFASQSSPTLFFGWPDKAPPRRLRVRWPDGKSSGATVTPTASTVSLTWP